ncbi:VanZ family protein [Clostridium saccharoperbutylacetonicum]|uniref:VanZ family protein n=1 Tax=Clostridium saccharoperbutylacetonicum TaxID=36745 RepID=UPI0039EB9227
MKNKRKILDWMLLIAWMILIFTMSNQPANISDSQSEGAIKLLLLIGIDANSIFGQLANFIVRKCAHFLEYMMLALLYINVAKHYFTIKAVIISTVAFVFAYACLDEIHQLFVPGREGAFRDVLIDTCGGVTLLLIRLGISSIKLLKLR